MAPHLHDSSEMLLAPEGAPLAVAAAAAAADAEAEGHAAGDATERDEAASAKRRRRRPSGITVGIALIAILLLVRVFVAEPFKIPSESMTPTLVPGDQTLVDKLSYRSSSPKRGDLVAFHAPRTGEVLLKRVVGVAGDSVGLEDGMLVVNGRRLHEAYADPKAIDSVYFGPVRVKPGTIFVLGDNRANSEDSRDFGAVSTKSIIGRAVARVWPPSRWGTLH
jgi:signal peptidase I